MASYEDRLATIDSRLGVLTWMVGFNLLIAVALLWRVFAPS